MDRLKRNREAVCVFCSSSQAVDPVYTEAAAEIGRVLGQQGLALIYGGTRIGLMGAVARAARENGASVTGIVPEHIRALVADCEDPEALIVTPDMRQRKALMEARAAGLPYSAGGLRHARGIARSADAEAVGIALETDCAAEHERLL